MLRVYFDNDVVSPISRRDWDNSELDAIDRLLDAKRTSTIVLGASRQSLREIERAPSQYQAKLKTGLSELILAENDHIVLGFNSHTDQYGGYICNPMVSDIIDEQMYSAFLASGLKEDDAKHLMYAVHNGYQRFLTCDNGILSRRIGLEKHCP